MLDLLTSGWVVFVFTIFFFWLPSLAFIQASIPSLASRLVGAFVRLVATLAIGGIVWTRLGLFTWLSAVFVYLTGLGLGWVASYQWQPRQKLQQLVEQAAIASVDIFDRGLSIAQVRQWLLSPWKSIERFVQTRLDRHKHNLPIAILTAIGTIAILGFAIWLRFEHPLTEFRYSHPDTYGRLLITQQILARDLPQTSAVSIFPSLAAFLSAMSGVHPLQVVHLLGAIVGTLLVLSVGYTMHCLTKNSSAALASSYSLGGYLFTWNLPISSSLPMEVRQCLSAIKDALDSGLIRSWAVSELELGALFVILAIGCSTHIARTQQRTAGIVNTSCCMLLVTIVAPNLSILLLFGGFGTIFGRQMALFTLSLAWTILGVLAALPGNNFPLLDGVLSTLPIGLSLLVGLLFMVAAAASRSLLANWSAPICLMVFIAITLNFCLPPLPQIDYLEYDAAARKAVEIGYLFRPHQWTVVAPIEQLSQVYGRGWYEDLAQFTNKYQGRVDKPSFHFPHQTTLLVFAEKQPFISDKPQYPVPYSVLSDPTYRYYRSPSGRAQLAAATLQLCETYRRNHPDSQIYYENDRLRIYQFAPRAD